MATQYEIINESDGSTLGILNFTPDEQEIASCILGSGELAKIAYPNNIFFTRNSELARWGLYHKMKTAADLVQIAPWFDLKWLDIVDKAYEPHDDNKTDAENKEAQRKAREKAIAQLKETIIDAGGLEANLQNPAEARRINQQVNGLIDAAFEKRRRLLGRIDAVYAENGEDANAKTAYFPDVAEKKLKEYLYDARRLGAPGNIPASVYEQALENIRAERLALASSLKPTDCDAFRNYIDYVRTELQRINRLRDPNPTPDSQDEHDDRILSELYEDVLTKIERMRETRGSFFKRNKSGLIEEVGCDPNAVVTSFGGGHMIKYEREGGLLCFNFIGIPKEKRGEAVATMFKQLNDRGDFWRGDIWVEGPPEFIDEIRTFARQNSLRISLVHGKGTHRLLYEEIGKEIAGDTSNIARGVVSVLAFVCDKNGKPRYEADGKPMITQVAVGSRQVIGDKGWPFPRNLLANLMTDDYGIDFPTTIQDECVFNAYRQSSTIPRFGVYIPEDNDEIWEAKLVNLDQEQPNGETYNVKELQMEFQGVPPQQKVTLSQLDQVASLPDILKKLGEMTERAQDPNRQPDPVKTLAKLFALQRDYDDGAELTIRYKPKDAHNHTPDELIHGMANYLHLAQLDPGVLPAARTVDEKVNIAIGQIEQILNHINSPVGNSYAPEYSQVADSVGEAIAVYYQTDPVGVSGLMEQAAQRNPGLQGPLSQYLLASVERYNDHLHSHPPQTISAQHLDLAISQMEFVVTMARSATASADECNKASNSVGQVIASYYQANPIMVQPMIDRAIQNNPSLQESISQHLLTGMEAYNDDLWLNPPQPHSAQDISLAISQMEFVVNMASARTANIDECNRTAMVIGQTIALYGQTDPITVRNALQQAIQQNLGLKTALDELKGGHPPFAPRQAPTLVGAGFIP